MTSKLTANQIQTATQKRLQLNDVNDAIAFLENWLDEIECGICEHTDLVTVNRLLVDKRDARHSILNA